MTLCGRIYLDMYLLLEDCVLWRQRDLVPQDTYKNKLRQLKFIVNNHGVIISHIESGISRYFTGFPSGKSSWMSLLYFRSSVLLWKGKSRKLQRPLYCYCLALFNIIADCRNRIIQSWRGRREDGQEERVLSCYLFM